MLNEPHRKNDRTRPYQPLPDEIQVLKVPPLWELGCFCVEGEFGVCPVASLAVRWTE